MSNIFMTDIIYHTIIIISIAAAAPVLKKICGLINAQGQYILLMAYILLSLLMCLQQDMRSYAVTAVFFMLLGILYYIKSDTPMYILWFGIAIAINYYVAFFFFAVIIADSSTGTKALIRKCFSLLLGFVPVCGVYFTEHFLFKNSTVCFWLPDFQLWNSLFDKHCLDGFYWFWFAYIFLLAALLVLFHAKDAHAYTPASIQFTAQKSIWTGFACYSLFLFFSQNAPDFIVLIIPFIILLTGAYISNTFENICLKAALLIGPPLICFSSEDFNYGIISLAARRIFNALSKLGFGAILVAVCAVATISFLYNSFPDERRPSSE